MSAANFLKEAKAAALQLRIRRLWGETNKLKELELIFFQHPNLNGDAKNILNLC